MRASVTASGSGSGYRLNFYLDTEEEKRALRNSKGVLGRVIVKGDAVDGFVIRVDDIYGVKIDCSVGSPHIQISAVEGKVVRQKKSIIGFQPVVIGPGHIYTGGLPMDIIHPAFKEEAQRKRDAGKWSAVKSKPLIQDTVVAETKAARNRNGRSEDLMAALKKVKTELNDKILEAQVIIEELSGLDVEVSMEVNMERGAVFSARQVITTEI